MELAAHFEQHGHSVERLSLDDVSLRNGPLARVMGHDFHRAAVPAARAIASRFDVIDAHQANLPTAKRNLEFRGLLVTRSAGLTHHYVDFARSARRRWPEARQGRSVAAPLRARDGWLAKRRTERMFEHSDLILVPNSDERAWLEQHGFGPKAVLTPNGIPDGLVRQDRRSMPTGARVSVIGAWDVRKGARDWPQLMDRITAEVPDAEFTFLGTGPEARVRRDLGSARIGRTTVVSHYESGELPRLLEGAKVGALPTYMEGFGIGLVEQMARGVPTVAYDVPGPRDTVGGLDPSLLVPVGDVSALAARVIDLLRLPRHAYEELSERARNRARQYAWSRVGDLTLDAYARGIEGLRRGS
jgi:glycosyltransferase involved in cell wall biosynthesis